MRGRDRGRGQWAAHLHKRGHLERALLLFISRRPLHAARLAVFSLPVHLLAFTRAVMHAHAARAHVRRAVSPTVVGALSHFR